ncbi:hypothetical protein [Streptomyces sp. NPDC056948]|uniref:hypothetical protein n=1 Tax=Streptomyces sp. NPDC056948 TaxID=3345975 RepID=UPI003625D1CB
MSPPLGGGTTARRTEIAGGRRTNVTWNLTALADACRSDARWSSLVTVKPLNLTGGVGSPANATALR